MFNANNTDVHRHISAFCSTLIQRHGYLDVLNIILGHREYFRSTRITSFCHTTGAVTAAVILYLEALINGTVDSHDTTLRCFCRRGALLAYNITPGIQCTIHGYTATFLHDYIALFSRRHTIATHVCTMFTGNTHFTVNRNLCSRGHGQRKIRRRSGIACYSFGGRTVYRTSCIKGYQQCNTCKDIIITCG